VTGTSFSYTSADTSSTSQCIPWSTTDSYTIADNSSTEYLRSAYTVEYLRPYWDYAGTSNRCTNNQYTSDICVTSVNEQFKEREKLRKAAELQAESLFVEIAGEDALKLLKERKFHEIIAPSGTRYRLRLGALVERMEGNFGEKIVEKLCIHHNYARNLPSMDTLIHQFLMLTCGQEDEFYSTANKHRVAA